MSVRLLRIAVVVVPVVLLLGVLHVLGPGLRRARLTKDLPASYGVIREIPEYVIYGEKDNERAAFAAEVLEQFTMDMRSEFGEMLQLDPPRSRFDVIVFSSHADLSDYGRARFDADFENNGGFYQPSDRVLAVIDRGEPENLFRALFHEGTHLMMDTWVAGSGHEWSLWINEGLATWFEDSRIGENGIRLGGVSPATRSALLGGTWIPLPRLLAATAEDFQGEDNSLYYAQSCLLVDFLMQGEYRSRFEAYFEAERRPGPVRPGTFEDVVGEVEEIDAALQDRLRTRD